MDAQPFVLWGDSALAAARERASGALAAWRAAWGVAGEGPGVECLRTGADLPDGSGWSACGIGGETAAWIRFDDAFSAAMQGAMFGAVRDAGLAAEVARDACDDLVSALLGALRGKPAARGALALESPPRPLFRHGAGTLHVLVEFAGAALNLLVPHRELCTGRARNAVSAGGAALDGKGAAIDGMGAAVGEMPVTLQAQIAAIEIDLGALNGLAPGDVIRLGAKVEQPLALVAPDGTTLFHGHLGMHEGARALDLVH